MKNRLTNIKFKISLKLLNNIIFGFILTYYIIYGFFFNYNAYFEKIDLLIIAIFYWYLINEFNKQFEQQYKIDTKGNYIKQENKKVKQPAKTTN